MICFGEEKVNKKFKNLNYIYSYLLILMITAYILTLNYYNDVTYIYSYGMGANLIIILCIIYLIIDVYSIYKNRNKLSPLKLLPLLILIIGFIVAFIIRTINPGLVFMTSIFSIVTVIMYNTIENPDVKLIEQLELAKDNAEKANNAKTDFLSSMLHEIRTPLNAIVGFSQDIKQESVKDDADLKVIENETDDIIMASQNLLEIVNGVLDISKIEANKMEIVESYYVLSKLLDDITKLIKPRIGEKPIEFKTVFSSDLPYELYDDKGKIKQIITNLLTNAVKYTEKGTIIFSVSCINSKNKSKLVISVEDTGRGIKQDKIDKLFTKFNRLEEDKNTTLEGTGLGLAITKKLVEMLGGRIIV